MDSSEIMDESDIFASPTKTPKTKHNARGSEAERPKTPSPANKATPFDAEEVREAALRRELEGMRNINQVIEGVIGTLEKAKGNMGVSSFVSGASAGLCANSNVDRLPNRNKCFHPPQHLDPHPLPDRAQPAGNSRPQLEWRNPRLGRPGERGSPKTVSCRAEGG